jgi:hypothetical protein
MNKDRIIVNKDGTGSCKRCEAIAEFSETYDAYYCAKCNLWLEEKCVDPLCRLCKKRPIRPLKPVKPKKEKIRIAKW